jgi:hypothetical protein
VASRLLRWLIGLTALTVVVVELVNLRYAAEPGFSLAVRTVWALLRVIGLLLLMRAVRLGRQGSRPFGLILAVTTVFAVARLTQPRQGSLLPPVPVVVGFVVLAALCLSLVVVLYRSDAIQAHLSRPVRRHIPGWVLTARVATVAYVPLLIVPCIVALGEIGAHPVGSARRPLARLILLAIWLGLIAFTGFIVPYATAFLLRGVAWARWTSGLLGVVMLLGQPALCLGLLGVDGLVRDGAPMGVTAVLGLTALRRSRGLPTWVRPGLVQPGEPTGA